MLTDALSFGAKAQKILDISDLIYPALHPQKSSQHLRACAARVGAICSKNKEKLSYITGTALILELARDYGLRPRLRLLLFFALALFFLAIIQKKYSVLYQKQLKSAIFYSKKCIQYH